MARGSNGLGRFRRNEDGFVDDIGEITGTARDERGLEDARETELEAGLHWREKKKKEENCRV